MAKRIEAYISNIDRDLKSVSGIYSLNINENLYVGSAVDLYQRLHTHKYYLLANKHQNTHLQRAFNKYKKVEFNILEVVRNKDELVDREQHYIDTLPCNLNIRRTAESNKGLSLSPEHRAKISFKLKLWHQLVGFSEETKRKIGIANTNCKRTEAQKQHLREMNTGKTVTQKTKDLLREKMTIIRATSSNYDFKGEKNSQSKLKDSDIVDILGLLKMGIKGVIIARSYNVSKYCISLIKQNKTYKHINRS